MPLTSLTCSTIGSRICCHSWMIRWYLLSLSLGFDFAYRLVCRPKRVKNRTSRALWQELQGALPYQRVPQSRWQFEDEDTLRVGTLAGVLLAMLAVVAVHAVLQAAVYGMDIIAKLVSICQKYSQE